MTNSPADSALISAAYSVAFGIGVVLIVIGIGIARYQLYGLIPGYRSAPAALQRYYDLPALAKHSGDGATTLGILVLITAGAVWLGYPILAGAAFVLFLLILLTVVMGIFKFMPSSTPAGVLRAGEDPHPLLRRLLPGRAFRSVEQGTREWLIECSKCGHKRDLWEAGGLRYKGSGEPRTGTHCKTCGTWNWHRIRRKTASDSHE